MTYLDSISLVRTLPCLAEPGKIIVIGRPSRTLEDVLPYMATLPSVMAFSPEGPSLTYRREPGILTLQGNEVYITQVKDLEEGLGLLSALVESINAVWDHREELAAVRKPARTPRPLDMWALLPQTNCKDCGEQTCMAFAVSLLQNRRLVSECAVVDSDVRFIERRTALEAMLPHLLMPAEVAQPTDQGDDNAHNQDSRLRLRQLPKIGGSRT